MVSFLVAALRCVFAWVSIAVGRCKHRNTKIAPRFKEVPSLAPQTRRRREEPGINSNREKAIPTPAGRARPAAPPHRPRTLAQFLDLPLHRGCWAQPRPQWAGAAGLARPKARMGRGFRRAALGRQGACIRRTSASSAPLGACAARCDWKENGARSLAWGVALTPPTEVLPLLPLGASFSFGPSEFERPGGLGPASGMVAEAQGVGLPRAPWRELGSLEVRLPHPPRRLQARQTPISEQQVSAWKRVGSSGFALWLGSPRSLSPPACAPRAAFVHFVVGGAGHVGLWRFCWKEVRLSPLGRRAGFRGRAPSGWGFGRGFRGHGGKGQVRGGRCRGRGWVSE